MDFKSSKMSGKSSFEKVTYCMIPRIQWKERTKFFLPSCSPFPFWCPYICSLHLRLYLCFANKIIYTIFSEKAMAPHSSTLVWKIPRMEEPGRLQSMGSQRVGHD